MQVDRFEVSIPTDGSGNGTGYVGPVVGTVLGIRYVADGTTPYAATVDFTITGEITGIPILTVTNETASNTYYPRAATVSVANAAALYAAGGTAVNERVPIAGERIKIVIAQGGATTTGKFYVLVG